ncbi:MAG TPA: 16S rRNA (cytidine(1402)-2'-O)-methyltransferase [Hyphomonadaceae bacterium]|nr:16S rRNA (cytidine(1402)-2'-O)-methyltransferase [Hyphomonadaceae bacterium]
MACATPPEDADPAREDADARGGDDSPQEDFQTQALTRIYRTDPGLAPGLYVVSTPIGNLRDVTLRALDILASVDVVCAEDTRVAGKLLSAFGVSARLRPYHDHNGAQARPGLLAELEKGARIALISDAGTPLISDPGYKLVREAAEKGISVFAIPGASAPLTALASSGLPTDRFMFAGFPPPKSAARKRFLVDMKSVQATLVFFEGPSRLAASLADMAEVLGPRDAAVARELTKKFEETRRGKLSELATYYAREGPPRGEIVVLVGPPPGEAEVDADAVDAAILAADDNRPLKDISAEIAERFGLRRRDIYERALELRSADEDN